MTLHHELPHHVQDVARVVAGVFLGGLTVLHASPARRELVQQCDASMGQRVAAHTGPLLICAPAPDTGLIRGVISSASPQNKGEISTAAASSSCMSVCAWSAGQMGADAGT